MSRRLYSACCTELAPKDDRRVIHRLFLRAKSLHIESRFRSKYFLGRMILSEKSATFRDHALAAGRSPLPCALNARVRSRVLPKCETPAQRPGLRLWRFVGQRPQPSPPGFRRCLPVCDPWSPFVSPFATPRPQPHGRLTASPLAGRSTAARHRSSGLGSWRD